MNSFFRKTCVRTILVSLFALSLSAQTKIKYHAPALITSAGQSADVTLAGMLFKRLNIESKISVRATGSELDGIKTLVIVPGFSSKGLGAAGISRDKELTRVKELLAEASKKNIPVLMLHIGGKPRRGQQSDDFNKMAGEAAQSMMVVKQGDEDQFFTKLAAEGKKPIEVVEKIAQIIQPLEAAFK